MNSKIRFGINTAIASLIAALGYGCHSKRVIIVDPPVDNPTRGQEEMQLMYGPPAYFGKDYMPLDSLVKVKQDTVPPQPVMPPEDIPAPKYGVPPEFY